MRLKKKIIMRETSVGLQKNWNFVNTEKENKEYIFLKGDSKYADTRITPTRLFKVREAIQGSERRQTDLHQMRPRIWKRKVKQSFTMCFKASVWTSKVK